MCAVAVDAEVLAVAIPTQPKALVEAGESPRATSGIQPGRGQAGSESREQVGCEVDVVADLAIVVAIAIRVVAASREEARRAGGQEGSTLGRRQHAAHPRAGRAGRQAGIGCAD